MTVLSAQQLVRLTDPGDGYTSTDDGEVGPDCTVDRQSLPMRHAMDTASHRAHVEGVVHQDHADGECTNEQRRQEWRGRLRRSLMREDRTDGERAGGNCGPDDEKPSEDCHCCAGGGSAHGHCPLSVAVVYNDDSCPH